MAVAFSPGGVVDGPPGAIDARAEDGVGEAVGALASAALAETPDPSVGDAPATPDGGGPLPFDPLSPWEERRAVGLALRADAAGSSDAHQVIGAALYTHKSFLDLEFWPRVAEVWIYDYTDDVTLRFLVDLDLGVASPATILDIDPPLTAAEIHRAGNMALGDARALQRLDDLGVSVDGLDWTARLWSGGEAHPDCAVHRCALVAMLDGDELVFDPLVLVDLSAGGVAGVLDADYRPLDGTAGGSS